VTIAAAIARRRAALVAALFAAAIPLGVAGQDTAKTYTDARRKAIVFPAGDASFADEIVAFDVGTPPPREARFADPSTTLGPPDYDVRTNQKTPRTLTLGCGGTLVVRFTDNALVDVAGPASKT